jgi:hypothetical protein
MRAAEPTDRAIVAIQDGLTAHFGGTDRQRVRELRRRIAGRIEADLALLDALDGDPDFEDCADAEPSLCGLDVTWPSHGGDDREAGDDNGIADAGGAFDQAQRYLRQGGDLYEASRLHWGCL